MSGDDDTIFLVDNVLNLVRDLDPNELYYFSDSLPSDGIACTFPEEASEMGKNGCIVTPPAAPCLRSVVESPDVCNSEKVHARGRRKLHHGGGADEVEAAGGTIWGFGQAGIVTSRGLINSISTEDFSACENCNTSRFNCYGGGDVRLGECFWSFGSNGRGLAPTIPYSHAGVHVFGHHLGEIMAEAHKVIEGEHCDDRCRFILDRVISTDIHHETPERYKQLTHEFSIKYAHAKRILHGKTHNSEMKVQKF